MRRLGLMLLLTATLHVVASAQETTGTITGVTSDQTGAVLPGVSVTIKNTNTATSRTVVTNEAGFYTASLLPVGTYEVSFELSGFQTVTLKNIDLHVNDRLKLDGHLSVGGVAESVEVSVGPVAGAADRRAAVDHDLDPGEGAAAQQPQLRSARDAGARRLERSDGRGGSRAHQHGQHLDQRRPPQRGQLAGRWRFGRGRGLEHHAVVDAESGVDRRVQNHHQRLPGRVAAQRRRHRQRRHQVGIVALLWQRL